MEPKAEGLNIKKYLFLFISHWYLFILFLLACYLVTYIINRYSVPQYEISGSVLIREKGSVDGSVESVLSEMGLGRRVRTKKEVENEIGLLKSYSLVRNVIDNLDFQTSVFEIGDIQETEMYGSNSLFRVICDTAHPQIYGSFFSMFLLSKDKYQIKSAVHGIDTVMKFGEDFITDYFSFKLMLNHTNFDEDRPNGGADNGFRLVINDVNKLVNLYRSKLSIAPIEEKATMLIISVIGENPQKESNFINMLCHKYIQSELDEKNRASENTIHFIDSQLQEIVDSLKLVEGSLQDFRITNQSIVDISLEGQRLLKRMETLESELALLNVKLKYINYLVDYSKKRQSLEDILAPSVMGIDDPMLTQLITQVNEAFLQRSEILYSSKENSPSLRLINNKIEDLQLRLTETLLNSAEGYKLSLTDLDKRMFEVQNQINKLPSTERKLINIRRKFEINDEIYTFLLQKRAEAGISLASNIADNKIVDYAIPENAVQVSPNKRKNNLLGILLGIIIPLIYILLKDFFNNKILEKADVEMLTDIPILATIGHVSKNADNQVAEEPSSFIAENFRVLKNNLQYVLNGNNHKIITVTSTVSGEGKTFVAVNLAAIFALAGKKTLLVGLDMRKPRIHKVFEINNNSGLSTYLINKNSVEEVILKTNQENIDVVSSGPIPPNPAELIESAAMTSFIDRVKKEYDYIILDTPPIALVSDTLHIMKFSDATMFVVRHNYTRKEMINVIDNMYKSMKNTNISLIINDLKDEYLKGGYGYNYGYNYGYAYGRENKKPQESFLRRLFHLSK